MKTLGVIANCGKPRAADVLGALKNRAAELGITLVTDDITASLLNAPVKPIDEMLEEVDAVMALGGDGTMLRVMRELGGRDKPVIGVNIGSLGFLTTWTRRLNAWQVTILLLMKPPWLSVKWWAVAPEAVTRHLTM